MKKNKPHPTHRESGNRAHFLRRHPWWTGLGVSLVLGLIFIFLILPPAMRWGIEKWLESHGRLQARIEEVDFNLFSGYLTVHSLVTERKDEGGMQWGRLSLEVEWRPIFKKRIRLDDLSLNRAHIGVVQEKDGEIYLGGLRIREADDAAPPADPNDADGWEIGFGTIDLENVEVQLTTAADETRELTIQQAHLDAFESWNPSRPSRFEADVAVEKGSFDLQGTARPLAPDARIDITLNARDFPLDWMAPFIWSETLKPIQGSLTADTQVMVSFSTHPVRSVTAELQGQVSLDRLRVALPGARIEPTNLNWNGSLSLSVDPEQAGPQATAEGVLTLAETDLRLDRIDLSAAVEKIRIEGRFWQTGQSSNESMGIDFRGEIVAKGLGLDPTDRKRRLAQAGELSIRGVDLSGGRVQAERIQLTEADLLERPASDSKDRRYGISLPAVSLSSIQANPKESHLRVKRLELQGARATLVVDPQGRLNVSDRLSFDSKPDKPPRSERSGPKWTVRIDRAELGKGGTLLFRDDRASPPIDLALSSIQATARPIDSRDPSQAMSLEVQMDVGKYGAFQASGSVTPFAEAIDMDVNGKIKQFNLPEIRGYAERFWGYTIRSGQLYADFNLRVENDQMDSQVKLFITRLDLNRQREDALHELTRQLGMPLGSALDLIRDSDHNIRLNLPVTGSLTQPEIGWGDVIGTAIKNATFQAIKTAALTYFAPLGAVYAATKIIGNAAALRLDPVVFEPGRSELAPQARTYLDQVARKIGDRPEARLLLCAKAVPRDRKALGREDATPKNESAAKAKAVSDQGPPPVDKSRLIELAENRAEAVHAYLSSRGIEPRRLVMCAPQIELGDLRPQVELAL